MVYVTLADIIEINMFIDKYINYLTLIKISML